MLRRLWLLWSSLSLVLCSACVQPPPRPPSRASLPVVPDGCNSTFEGRWVHADDDSWHYDAVDDGGTLTFTVSRTPPTIDAGFRPRRFRPQSLDAGVDAGITSTLDAGAHTAKEPNADASIANDGGTVELTDAGAAPLVRIVLSRTPKGFVGDTFAQLAHPTGRICDAAFHTEITSCSDGGLELTTEASIALGDACQVPARPQPSPPVRHRLTRAP